jgi:hypothetical protein
MVSYPNMRMEVIQVLRALSSREYQIRAWVNHDFPPGIEYDCFDVAVNLLLDEMGLITDPESSLGVVLENAEEVTIVKQVAEAIDEILNKLGDDLTDEEYITDPDWVKVIETASKALMVLEKPAQ